MTANARKPIAFQAGAFSEHAEMSLMLSKVVSKPWYGSRVFFIALGGIFLFSVPAFSETYGVKDDAGAFIPKVTVSVKNKEILIKKKDPQAKFGSISLTVNKKNKALQLNVGLLKIQWLNAEDQGGKPILFAGPHYDPATKVFKESMQRSAGLKIIESTTKDLFAGKEFPDLFTLHIDDHLCISSESFYEKDRTVKLGTGKDLSMDVRKTSVHFDEGNLKTGEIVDVDNRSGYNQSLGVSIPTKGLLYYQIIRRPEQTKVPKESWERFPVEADSGISIFLIPETDPLQLAALNGKEITIKVWDGNKVRETRRIPITVSSDLSLPQGESAGQIAGKSTRGQAEEPHPAESPLSQISRTVDQDPTPARQRGAPEQKAAGSGYRLGGLWLWAIQIFNLALLLSLGAYGIFFMLPKIQVLEDRLAKNEMFIHGSREAIREELEEIKEEILRQCRRDPPSE